MLQFELDSFLCDIGVRDRCGRHNYMIRFDAEMNYWDAQDTCMSYGWEWGTLAQI